MTVNGRSIQSVEVGGRLLAALAGAIVPMMLRDLAAAARMPAGKAHAYLVSFRKLGLVEQDASGRYKLGPFALDIGLARLRGAEPYQIASEAIMGLAQELDLSVAITVWGTYGPTVVRIQEASHQIHVNVRPGTVFGLSTTATGKVFAAFMPATLVNPLIKAELGASRHGRTGKTHGIARLTRELATIRDRGVASTKGRPIPGINALSAPVFDHSGQMQLAVTLMGPATTVNAAIDGAQSQALLRFTRRLSEELGFRSQD